jgi:8-oxo-dGTP pyrophosphatase MutT (NUDIX family)
MDAGATVTLESLRTRLLSEEPPLVPARSDYDLNPALGRQPAASLTPSAVLIPIVMRLEPSVLFTRRSAGLKRHAGQVCFPGGAADATDTSLVATALRELNEEVGIDPGFVTVAGFLKPYETVTGFAVLPVVGLVRTGFTIAPDAREVEAVFEVPLRFLLDPDNCTEEELEWNGARRRFYAFHYQDHTIWGATAAILVTLAERLR